MAGVFQPDVFQHDVFQTGATLTWPVHSEAVWPADTDATTWIGAGHDEAWPVDDEPAWPVHAGGNW